MIKLSVGRALGTNLFIYTHFLLSKLPQPMAMTLRMDLDIADKG